MDKLDICVTRTIDSGVRPIAIRCTPIFDCLFSGAAGLRTSVNIHSVDYGTLRPADYMPALEGDRDSAASFTARNLRVLLSALPALQERDRGLALVTLSCPVSLVRRGALPGELTRLLRSADPRYAGAVCLSFGPELLSLPLRDLQNVILHIHSLGCKLAVVGYGRADFPMSVLPAAAPDLLVLPCGPKGAPLTPAALAAYVRFAGSLGIRVLADGVADEPTLTQLRDAECHFYTPAPGLRVGGQPLPGEKELSELMPERSVPLARHN